MGETLGLDALAEEERYGIDERQVDEVTTDVSMIVWEEQVRQPQEGRPDPRCRRARQPVSQSGIADRDDQERDRKSGGEGAALDR